MERDSTTTIRRKYRDLSLVIAGDFNSMSHLDWSEVAADQFVEIMVTSQ